MLGTCLECLRQQAIPANCHVTLIVADNEAEPNNRMIVDSAAAAGGSLKFCYVHEPRRGIAHARNAILDACGDRFDWIAFTDDDCQPSPSWIASLLASAEWYGADVIYGRVEYVPPQPVPFWYEPLPVWCGEGQSMQFAGTTNVLMAGKLARLRFNPRMAHGEDAEFFWRATNELGVRIVHSVGPVVYEMVPPHRTTLAYWTKRWYYYGAVNTYLDRRHRGWRYASGVLSKRLRRAPGALVRLAIAPLMSRKRYRRRVLRDTHRLADAAGALTGILGYIGNPYRKVGKGRLRARRRETASVLCGNAEAPVPKGRHALFLCADRAMFPIALFAANSALRNATARPVDAYMLVPENTLEPHWLDWAQQHVQIHIKEVGGLVHRVGITRTSRADFPPRCAIVSFFDLVVPESYERIVYMDADMRAAGDISRLFDLDLGQHAFAACPDGPMVALGADSGTWQGKHLVKLGLAPSLPYLNSGLLLMDVQRWHAEDLSNRVLSYVREHLPVLPFADQDALNVIAHDACLPISPVWNFQTQVGSAKAVGVAPAVLHYAGPEKPWRPLTWHGDAAEREAWSTFFRSSPWPGLGTAFGDHPTWKQLRRYAKRQLREQILGKPPKKPPRHDQVVAPYKAHIHAFDYADRQQGLVAFDAAGVLRAIPRGRTTIDAIQPASPIESAKQIIPTAGCRNE
jgi:glycosyltransferase involved in cell wall biosynthesis